MGFGKGGECKFMSYCFVLGGVYVVGGECGELVAGGDHFHWHVHVGKAGLEVELALFWCSGDFRGNTMFLCKNMPARSDNS